MCAYGHSAPKTEENQPGASARLFRELSGGELAARSSGVLRASAHLILGRTPGAHGQACPPGGKSVAPA